MKLQGPSPCIQDAITRFYAGSDKASPHTALHRVPLAYILILFSPLSLSLQAVSLRFSLQIPVCVSLLSRTVEYVHYHHIILSHYMVTLHTIYIHIIHLTTINIFRWIFSHMVRIPVVIIHSHSF
jgi:hypothetical protein